MAHLEYMEILGCVDSFLVALFGPENYHRWKNIKMQMSADSEKEFVSWMLDTVEHCYGSQLPNLGEKRDGSGPMAPEQRAGGTSDASAAELHHFLYENGAVEQGDASDDVGARCRKCAQHFDSKSALKLHNKRMHGGGLGGGGRQGALQQRYKCEQCYKLYTTKQGLDTHRNAIHNHVKSIRCQFCHATFLTRREKTSHEQLAHADLVKVHTCDLCQKNFTERCTMLKHKRYVHLSIKKHKCHYCDKHFQQASDARKHEANVHLGVKAFACISCDRKFTTKTTMVYHYQREHGDLAPPPVSVDAVATPLAPPQKHQRLQPPPPPPPQPPAPPLPVVFPIEPAILT